VQLQLRIGGTMRHVPGTRALALVAGLLFGATGSALAQDTTETGAATIDTTAPTAGAIDTAGLDTATSSTDTSATRDTTDTSAVENPSGYQGMERDTTMSPDSGGAPASPGGSASSEAGRDTLRIDPTDAGSDST
jgi:hypothetical protein